MNEKMRRRKRRIKKIGKSQIGQLHILKISGIKVS